MAWTQNRFDQAQPGRPSTSAASKRQPGDNQRFALDELEQRTLLSAVLITPITEQYIPSSGGSAAINLNEFFDDTDITGTVVRYDTSHGEFDVEIFDVETPNTALNFLGYVDRGDYDGTFFHRSALTADNTPFVVQGGGFEYSAPNNYDPIFQGPSVLNEYGISNTRGTLAMAKLGGDPDSATNQWFFNMGDNSANLDNQNGGFTVFGQVLGDGMDVVDQIAATPIWNASSLNSAFSDLPLIDYDNASFPDENDLVMVNSITRTNELTFRVVETSIPNRLVGVVDDDGILSIFTVGVSVPQTITVTVEAEDHDGNTTQATFTVNVGAAKDSLNNDKTADLTWRNFSSGKNTVWEMDGFTRDAATALDKVNNTTWYIAAVGDFNKDGSNDLFWRNAFDGQNKIWLMDGTDFVSSVDLRTTTNQNLEVGGLGDFDNDGNIDILWHNAKNGKNVVWTMDGTTEDGSLVLERENGAGWYIGGVGDFNQDGTTDIMWRNEIGGQNKVWLLNPFDGSLQQSKALLSLEGSNWVATGIADYNLNKQYDIIFRNTKTGKQQVWVMNGTNRSNVRTDIPRLKSQDWQLPGRASQLAARDNALTKIQRQKRRAAKLKAKTVSQASNSAAAVAASVQASESTASLLGEVEPIFTLDLVNNDQDSPVVIE